MDMADEPQRRRSRSFGIAVAALKAPAVRDLSRNDHFADSQSPKSEIENLAYFARYPRMEFKPFNPDGETHKFRNHLPHWRQNGTTYFVTSRLGDSIPKATLDAWFKERALWLRANHCASVDDVENLPEEKRRAFHRHFTEKFHKFLDAGMGECLLRQPPLAQIVADAFRFFDGQRYELGEFVVMPNHVHLLLTPKPEHDLSGIMQSLKRHTPSEINKRLGREGSLWQQESFSHIVRIGEQLAKFQRYIAENPAKARLKEGEYLLWKPT